MEYNKVAAKWWADKIRNVGLGNFNNGNTGSSGGIAMAMASMIALKKQSSSEAIDLFEEKLAETIKESVEKCGPMTLSVDYDPDCVLSSHAEEAGVSLNAFPWKTMMWISEDKVSVSCGYGAPSKVIFPI